MKTRRFSFRADGVESRNLCRRWKDERVSMESFSAWARRTLAGNGNPGSPHPPVRMLCVKEVVVLLDCSRMTLFRMVRDERFPAPVRIGGRIFWPHATISQWILSQGILSR